jgi:hypothetical protein
MSSGEQNMKTGPNALGTAGNEFGSAKNKKRPDPHDTVENVFESTKHKNGSRRSRYRRNRVLFRKI